MHLMQQHQQPPQPTFLLILNYQDLFLLIRDRLKQETFLPFFIVNHDLRMLSWHDSEGIQHFAFLRNTALSLNQIVHIVYYGW